MRRSCRLSLRSDGRIHGSTNGVVQLTLPWSGSSFERAPASGLEALHRLASAGGTEDELASVAERGGFESLAWFYRVLDRIERQGGLRYAVEHDHAVLAYLEPISPRFRPGQEELDPDHPLVLSPFAFARRAGTEWNLESPLSHARVSILEPRLGFLPAALARPTSPRELTRVLDADPRLTMATARLLWNAGLVTCARDDGQSVHEADPELSRWEFADLLFHWHSRGGRRDEPIGRVAPSPDDPPTPLPAASQRGAHLTFLPRPDLDRLIEHDPPFTHVLEERRSIRAHGSEPLSLQQLGEFLFRVARVRAPVRGDRAGRAHETSSRPYPGGGACYELELYPVVLRQGGVAPGVYHYDPLHHGLTALPDAPGLLPGWIIPDADGRALDVLIAITARFERVNRKYRSTAYALVLKDTGVLLQTMYLVATAMGLAGCALGWSDSDRLGPALGVPFYRESAVGEFLLGTRPEE